MNLLIKQLQTEEQKKWLENSISATGETQKVEAAEKRDTQTTHTQTTKCSNDVATQADGESIDKEVENRVQAEKN
ncbi:hypothetical protein JTB14_030586 [Gonioctena quinquepunctata]|nr:hypothetical protein JTB14_030586 [Gonioctena quinquepunctata]